MSPKRERTKREVMDLPPGRLLDYYVYAYGMSGEVKTIGFIGDYDWYSNWAHLPPYSTSLEAAMGAWNRSHGDHFELRYDDTCVDWACKLFGGNADDAKDGFGNADGSDPMNAALAVCRALIDLRWRG